MMAFKNSDVVKNTFCSLALRVKFSADDIVFFFFSIFQRKKRKKENDMAFLANCLHNTNEMSNHVFWKK